MCYHRALQLAKDFGLAHVATDSKVHSDILSVLNAVLAVPKGSAVYVDTSVNNTDQMAGERRGVGEDNV